MTVKEIDTYCAYLCKYSYVSIKLKYYTAKQKSSISIGKSAGYF